MAKGMKRGCGSRKKGGIYSTCPLGPGGTPVEEFLKDPPLGLPEGLSDLARQGVMLFDRDGVTHVLDWVGSNHYPNVADFIEEVKRMGMSRRMPSTTDFARLGPMSQHFLVHERAIVAHPELYRPVRGALDVHAYDCPKSIAVHCCGCLVTGQPPMCAGIWWEDLDGAADGVVPGDRGVERHISCGSYRGMLSPIPAGMREYMPGIFAAFPISRLEVVKDDVADRHDAAADKAGKSKLDVELCDD